MRTMVLIALLAACGSDDDGDADAMFDHTMCLGDEEPLVPGTTVKLGAGGVFKLHVLATDPDPLVVGNNTVDVRVTDAADTPVAAATFEMLETWARIHDHGSPITPEAAPLGDPGEFTVAKMNVIHPGSWLFRFTVGDGTDSDFIEFNWGVECP